MAGIVVVVELVAPVAVAAVLAALGVFAAEASFPAYFSAAKTCPSVGNYIVRNEGALVFVVVEFGSEVASEFVTEVETGPEPEPEPGGMTADFVFAEIVAVESVAEAEVFG